MMSLRWAGLSLVLAAILFWISWLLMPGVGITDAALIFELVARNRVSVALSAGVQLCSAALFAPAMVGMAYFAITRRSRLLLASAIVMLIGSMGVAADVIFHLLAYEMTAPGVDRAQMLPIMRTMQQQDLLFIMPMIAAFFIGAIMMSIAAARLEMVTRWNPWLYPAALLFAIVGRLIVTQLQLSPRPIGLTVLAIVSAGIGWVGYGLSRQVNIN